MQLLAPNLACPGNPLLNELTGTFKDKNDENLDAESIGKHKNKIDDKTQDGEKSQRSSRKRRGPDQTPERKAVPPAEFSRLLAAVGSSQANPEECASPPKKLRLDDRDQEKVNCAKELISTEETYVQALERLQEVFLTPLVTKVCLLPGLFASSVLRPKSGAFSQPTPSNCKQRSDLFMSSTVAHSSTAFRRQAHTQSTRSPRSVCLVSRAPTLVDRHFQCTGDVSCCTRPT